MIEIAPEAPIKQPRTFAEAAFYNAGVIAVLRVAESSAQAIGAMGKRPIHEAFAAVALQELAERSRALLRYIGEEGDDAPMSALPNLPILPPLTGGATPELTAAWVAYRAWEKSVAATAMVPA